MNQGSNHCAWGDRGSERLSWGRGTRGGEGKGRKMGGKGKEKQRRGKREENFYQ